MTGYFCWSEYIFSDNMGQEGLDTDFDTSVHGDTEGIAIPLTQHHVGK